MSSALASTQRPFRMRKGISTAADLRDGAALSFGVGNVYYVIKTNESYYGNFTADHGGTYPDGSEIVYGATAATSQVAIQAAITACVEGRNDYVVVMPSDSDYDLTDVITVNKKCVHVVCPAGFGYERGATNACRLHQTTDAKAIFAVTDASVEIAGFYFKNYQNHSAITMATGAYAPNIHNNTFVISMTSTTAEPLIACTGDAPAWGGIERNWFISQAGDDGTIAIVVDIPGPATGARCNYNDFMMGDGNTATVAISMGATKGSANFNTFASAGNDGGYTHCISLGTWATAIGNRGTVADSILITGGTASYSLSDNMNGASGGAIDEA